MTMRNEYIEMERNDTLRGTVTGGCDCGLFIMLENGMEAFSYFGSLDKGTEVLCTVKYMAKENRRTLVTIDSVYDAFMAA